MREIGIGLVNMQAAEIKILEYPEWARELNWTVTAKVGTDEHGYDLYQIDRPNTSMVIPANRMVLMRRIMERLNGG